MKRKIGTAILVSALAQLALADSAVQQAQEQLKEQGYYFGQINGDKNADTVAAIRRFQIRNGMRVTGELDQETLRAFQSHLGIPPNGRLDMDTLAALGLLPGQHGRAPMEIPHRRFIPSEEPPVRGEWIH